MAKRAGTKIKDIESKTVNPDFWKDPQSKEILKLLSITKRGFKIQRTRKLEKRS
jgi:hypothetical protein